MNPNITVGIVGGYHLSSNMEGVLKNWGKMFGDAISLDVVLGDECFDQSIRESYRVFTLDTDSWLPTHFDYLFRAVRSYIVEQDPDGLINICKPQTSGLAAVLAASYRDIPVAVRMTGETFRQVRLSSGPTNKAKRFLLHELMARSAYRGADWVLPVGTNLRSRLRRRGISSGAIRVMPQPFDPSEFRPVGSDHRRDLRRTLGLQSDAKIILFVGRISRRKGSDRLLKVARLLKSASSRFQFCLVGDGPHREHFENFADSFVKLPGRVPRDEVPKYYKASDVLVFPSRTEGLPNVVLEAIAARLPILASPVGEVPNYVARTVNSPEEIAASLENAELAPEPEPEWFDWQLQRRRYRKLFRDLTDSSDGN